jgi:gamma-glutamyltranspeptidase/glutathione hydrolase
MSKGTTRIVGGCVAGSDPRTVEAGAEMLRAGGNAADAAVAAALAACVVEFSLVSIGGAGIATVQPAPGDPAGDQPICYDFFCATPGKGDPKPDPASIDLSPVTIDFGVQKQTFYCGPASIGLPGVVAGMGRISRKHGRLPWKELLQPAIALANSSIRVSEIMWPIVLTVEPVLRLGPEARRIFAPTERFANDGWRQSDLAGTLERLAEAGPDDFYSGDVARAILADLPGRGCLINEQDLATYEVLELKPNRVQYRDAVVSLPPGPSWGGRLIRFALELLESVDLSAERHPRSPLHAIALAEAMRFSDRARRENSADLDRLGEMSVIQDGRARLNAALHAKHAGAAEESLPGGMPCTTQVSAVDSDGLAVSTTISTGVGSGTVAKGTGILFNNMMGETDLNPDGFHTRPAGARMSTMMAPSLANRADGSRMVLGSAGSNRIRSAITQALGNWLDFNLPVDACVNNPRLHFENDVMQIEAPEPGLLEDLAARGYEIVPWPKTNLFFGGVNAVRIEADGRLSGAGDRRREGACQVVPAG